ncbi:MAG TPA: TIGR02679 domain-containing protein, partial [Anaerovoracaceae bacterium]|nr:TIGR02679 domain-containing protein [Anaerovoracaceae bacterium]
MLEDCVKYFKGNKAYKRLFIELRKKWKKYGGPSGYAVINNATAEEQEAIKLVMGKSCGGPDVRLRVSDFEDALQETKFKGVGLRELLEAYFSESMVTNKNVR